jgi:hypothetical protein
VASIKENQAAADQEEEERGAGLGVKENQLQALLRQLDPQEFRPPAAGQVWDIRTAAKKFRDQQQQGLKVNHVN